MFKFLNRFFASNEKELNKMRPLVSRINDLGSKVADLDENKFKAKTEKFRKQVEKEGVEALDNILPEAFALCREAAWRKIGERPYDVQLMAGIVLHQGKVAEQKTGEGKTLSAVPALYLNALAGKGVHLVTVNDYLARRDAGWMGPVFHYLGMTTSAIIHDQSFIYDSDYLDRTAMDWRLKNLRPVTRTEAYQADITYGINSEYGFDYLRDNMVNSLSELRQRDLHYAIIDEVDSVLIDEARTPHIISAPAEEATDKYRDYARLIKTLNPDSDFVIDEKMRTANLTEKGILKVEKILGVANLFQKDFKTIHHLEAALKAQTLFQRDKDYVVKDNQVIIVDEFTGRLMHGRRFSEGIHQALEAKEAVTIQQESRTLATISLQNYFRMYNKLAGMTGTAATEAEEFHEIYKLDVVVIPTNKPMIRRDHSDVVYKTTRAKYAALAQEVADCYRKGRPVLIGTTSIEKNEIISELLKRKGIPHNVLNAKNHAQEAQIISQAGTKKAITVATNMAGRGVDIILGGMTPNKYEQEKDVKKDFQKQQADWQEKHQQIIKLGGLHVIGSERHESRRIDNQLRGRAGRQGDPGSSRFYVALDDEIMRLFGGEQVAKLMTVFKMPEDVPLEHAMVSRAIQQAQSKVESFHFDSRKHLVEYDDVVNKQREIIYRLRRKILQKEKLTNKVLEKIKNEIKAMFLVISEEKFISLEKEEILKDFLTIIPIDDNEQKQIIKQLRQFSTIGETADFLSNLAKRLYLARIKDLGEEIAHDIEKWVYLQVTDTLWQEHLDSIDDLRAGIGLRGYAQRDPLVEFKKEAFDMFDCLMSNIESQLVRRIYKVEVVRQPIQPLAANMVFGRGQMMLPARPGAAIAGADNLSPIPSGWSSTSRLSSQQSILQSRRDPKTGKKLGRNDPCFCGSKRKFKKCHGR